MTFHPSIPEVNVSQDVPLKRVGAIPSPCRQLSAPGRTDARPLPPLSFSAYVTEYEVATHIPPPSLLLYPRTFFFFSVGVGRGRFESMLSAVPKGPGAASATGHLPPPATAGPGGGAQGQRGRGGGPCASRRSSAPAPGRRAATRGTPGSLPPRPVPGRAGSSGAAGTQQMGCGARGPPPNRPSPCPRVLLPYPSPGLARVGPAEVRGEQGCGPGEGRWAGERTMAVSPKSGSFPC